MEGSLQTFDYLGHRLTTWIRVKECLLIPAFQRNEREVQFAVQLVHEIPFFSGLARDDLRLVVDMMKVEVVSSGHCVLEKGVCPSSSLASSRYDCGSSFRGFSAADRRRLSRRFRAGNMYDDVAGKDVSAHGTYTIGLSREVSAAVSVSFDRRPGSSNVSPSSACYACNDYVNDDDNAGCVSSDSGCAEMIFLAFGKLRLHLPRKHEYQSFVQYPGDVVNDTAVWSTLPDGARIIALETSFLLKLAVEPNIFIDRALHCCQDALLTSKVNFLRHNLRVNLFEDCSDDELAICARELLPLRVCKGDVLISEGAPADCLFFIIRGSASVTRNLLINHERGGGKTGSVSSTYTGLTSSEAIAQHHPNTGCKLTRMKSRAMKPRPTSSPRRRAENKAISLNEIRKIITSPAPIVTSARRSVSEKSTIPQIDVATVGAGDFVGELEIMWHNPDVPTDGCSQWGEEFWREKLLSRSSGPPVMIKRHTKFGAPLVHDHFANDQNLYVPHSTIDVVAHETDAAACMGGSEEIFPSEMSPAILREQAVTRYASVRAITPMYMYRLSFDACRSSLPKNCVKKLNEHVKNYHAYSQLVREYNRQLKWTAYRRNEMQNTLRMTTTQN